MLYLAPFIGSGVYRDKNGKPDGYRPRGIDGMPSWAMLDLCPAGTSAPKAEDRCLVWVPDATPLSLSDAAPIIADKSEAFGRASETKLRSELGVDLKDAVDGVSLMKLLLFRGGTRWNGVVPEVNTGWKRVYLAGVEWANEHVSVSKQLGIDPSDSFIRANETPLASPWTRPVGGSGNINLASNTIASSADGDKFYYYLGAVSHADQFSEFRQNSAVTDDDWGAAVRIGSSGAFSGYFYSNYSPSDESFCKFVGGSFFFFATANQTNITNGDVQKVQLAGSSMSAYRNGVAVAGSPQTDTSLTTAGNGVGIFMFASGGGLNNFQGGNLATAYPSTNRIPGAIMTM